MTATMPPRVQSETETHDKNYQQRLHRNYAELLQEVRVAQTGIQLLLGFLFAMAFTNRFDTIDSLQRSLYVTSLVLCAAASALMIAPAAFHRVVFRRRLRPTLVKVSNRFVLAGLTLLMAALSSALLLTLDVVLGFSRAFWITIGVTTWFCLLWYVFPLYSRVRQRDEESLAERGRHRSINITLS
ncbi:DUF6328 family protein [Amycolatopsis sp. WQ 127309]|uniref:DUF6328 family protein n=1 Tax=Amycolatopsis sp. WQ 127309 TaxID=2932773 RepID=UPI001FF6411D|nr:DUF6328 family protein [Amycolatopsis sp. WQ 127309]UOZ06900.1 DUF6328 family protein [Amycolatopsis sp. WQ 127309]